MRFNVLVSALAITHASFALLTNQKDVIDNPTPDQLTKGLPDDSWAGLEKELAAGKPTAAKRQLYFRG